jgi:hypothetical protein
MVAGAVALNARQRHATVRANHRLMMTMRH